ncbi:hypothetical protein EVAR_60676_1 [Eumeta japonica]|uniref:Uncharacterized protein n=1 Tax=Eumeta variegata TaxID=151549 RepID=A0A4C1ZRU6_EUMVA|nr:hypothetical protein EVAR_60676_1 [Eumeta japonica]
MLGRARYGAERKAPSVGSCNFPHTLDMVLKLRFLSSLTPRPSIETVIERQKGSPNHDALEGQFGRAGRYVERKTPRPFCRLERTSAGLAYLKAINKEDLYHTHTHICCRSG